MSEHHPHVEGALRRLALAVVTVSSSRGAGEDRSGDRIQELAERHGHEVVHRAWVPDRIERIRDAVEQLLDTDVHALVLTGGTGVTPSDVTVEAVEPLFEKCLPAFGVLFTQLSYEEIGPAALLSRATAGVARGKAVFCIPGSPKACTLALKRIVLPELPHLMGHIRAEQ